jgi:hypothetical protein
MPPIGDWQAALQRAFPEILAAQRAAQRAAATAGSPAG